MTDETYTPWIMARIDKAAQDWDDQPEWTKPVVDSPYFATRGGQSSKETESK